MRLLDRNLLLLALLPVLASAGCRSVGTREKGIDNFAVVVDGPEGICRGAQPLPEGYEVLRQRGVRTIINLRDDARVEEKSDVEAAGLTYVHIPTSAGKIEPDKIRQFLNAVQASPRGVFVHCAFGCDRTGLEIAMYRIVIENWSREQAIGELYNHGYHWALYPGIVRYLRTFPMTDYRGLGVSPGRLQQTDRSGEMPKPRARPGYLPGTSS